MVTIIKNTHTVIYSAKQNESQVPVRLTIIKNAHCHLFCKTKQIFGSSLVTIIKKRAVIYFAKQNKSQVLLL